MATRDTHQKVPLYSAEEPLQLAEEPLYSAEEPPQLAEEPLYSAEEPPQLAEGPPQLAKGPSQLAEELLKDVKNGIPFCCLWATARFDI